MNVEFLLVDIDHKVTDAWQSYFNDLLEFTIVNALIFESVPSRKIGGLTALVSPANSFGDMTGGIDGVYTDEFGDDLQKQLQHKIETNRYGELVVGDALTVPIPKTYTGHVPIDLMISAPTMRHPSVVIGTMNAYLAFRAVLIRVVEWNKKASTEGVPRITRVICPGLATAIGRMPPLISASQMRMAYDEILRRI